jgi:hypothetical protein
MGYTDTLQPRPLDGMAGALLGPQGQRQDQYESGDTLVNEI